MKKTTTRRPDQAVPTAGRSVYDRNARPWKCPTERVRKEPITGLLFADVIDPLRVE